MKAEHAKGSLSAMHESLKSSKPMTGDWQLGHCSQPINTQENHDQVAQTLSWNMQTQSQIRTGFRGWLNLDSIHCIS